MKLGMCVNRAEGTTSYDVEVVDYQKPCRAYLWNVSGRSRGLIVDIEDKEGVRSAEEAYNNKEYIL